MLATELNLLKFECPHCGQRIACAPAHAGHPMVCPTCQGGLQVPWAPDSEPQLRLQPRTPTAAREPLYPRPTNEDFWTEAEWNQRLAADRRQKIKGFFTVQGQMYYAAFYAIIAVHAGIWLGWQDAHDLVGAPWHAFGDPSVFGRLPETNAAFWMLVGGAILTGHAIARNPHLMPFGLPYPTGTLWGRRRWWKDERPEDSKRMDWGSAWVVLSMTTFLVELLICLFGGFICALVKHAFTGW